MGLPVAQIDARLVRGQKLAEAGELNRARNVFKAVCEEFPGAVAGWINLGAVEDEISRQSDGLFGGKDAFAKALSLRVVPNVVNDLGCILLRNELRWREAEMFYREAVIRHGFADAAENLAVCLLNTATAKGTSEGWREAWQWYEQRKLNKLRGHRLLWRGEELSGKRLVVHTEQGFGDHVWAFRFLKQAKEEGATVCLVAHPNTIRLAAAQDYVDEIYNEKDAPEVPADFVTMLMSMPGYMLAASMPKTEGKYITTGVAQPSGRPRIGIAWNGSVDKGYQAWRNIDLKMFAPIMAAYPDAEWVSLQKGHHAADAPQVKLERSRIAEARDLWDTAQIIEGLDLVISVDTLIPHLSAALGVETWLLDRWSSCWQWGITEADPGWYQHLTIHRQPAFKEWGPVVEAISGKLKNWEPDRVVEGEELAA